MTEKDKTTKKSPTRRQKSSTRAVSKKDNETTPKKKRPSNGKNSPVIGMNGYNLKPGDNAKYIGVQIALFNMPKINIRDEQQVAKRLEEYFQLYGDNDMKPTVNGMAMALGISRQTLSAVAHDLPTGGGTTKLTYPKSVSDLIKKAYQMMENLWESYMSNYKIHPTAGIFMGKNYYGCKDSVEHVLTPNTNNEDDYDAEAIKQRYLESGQE